MASIKPEASFPILKKGHGRYKDVRRANIIIMGKVSDAIKPALGPNGMSKMLVTATGDVCITSSGRAILENMQTLNEITKLMIELARTQSDITGDGTKTAAVLTGELLKKADKLLKMKIHPRVIIDGYQRAGKKALEVLERNAIELSVEDETRLLAVAKAVIGGKATDKSKEHLAKLVVSSIKAIAETSKGKTKADPDNIVIRKKDGASINESRLVRGLIIYKDKPHASMPDRIEGAKLALIGSAIDPFIYETGETLREYDLNTPEQLRSFKDGEKKYYQDYIDTLKRSGTNALFCQKRVSKMMQAFLAKERILAFDLVSEKDMVRLAKVTGAQIVTKLGELAVGDIGSAGLMEFRNISGDEMLFIEQCPFNNAVTLLIRGGSSQVVDELEGIMNDCVKTEAIALEHGKALWGGGAVEMEIWKELKNYSSTFTNKEQLAIDAFGDAIEEIPKALASNAGVDYLNAITELREKHERGLKNAGVSAIGGTPAKKADEELLDSYRAKQHAIKIATETATMVLGISDIITVTNPGAIKRAAAEREMEQKRIQDEKLRVAFKEKESLKEVTKLDREMMDRAMHPDNY
jgi:chaperonin GroEL (HSP60 family)